MYYLSFIISRKQCDINMFDYFLSEKWFTCDLPVISIYRKLDLIDIWKILIEIIKSFGNYLL